MTNVIDSHSDGYDGNWVFLYNDGHIEAYGDALLYGINGPPTGTNNYGFIKLGGGDGGGASCFALREDGSVYLFGYDGMGQVSSFPTQYNGRVIDLAQGWNCGYALIADYKKTLPLYVNGTVSAESYIDRTPYPKDINEAKTAITSFSVKNKTLGKDKNGSNKTVAEVDHDALADIVKVKKYKYVPKYKSTTNTIYGYNGEVLTNEVSVVYQGQEVVEEVMPYRDTSMTISCLIEVVKDLMQQVEALKTEVGKIKNK